MPYTPPSRSPASSNANSPVLSRNHSYEGPLNQSQRPSLPRSRSAAYIQKHRRTPSLAEQQQNSTTTIYESTTAIDHSLHNVPSKNRHPAPSAPQAVDQLTGETSTVSPTESSGTSDDEDTRGRGRQIQDLANSLKNIVLFTRTGSPRRDGEDVQSSLAQAGEGPVAKSAASPALTPAARKIAHSRSSSEIQLSKLADVPSQAASSDSEDEDLHIKPPMVRKKSGELVKPALRPSSRRRPSSMPGTPTFSKAVHFNEDIEQVRHFLQVDRPSAVSAGSSPAETYDSESEYPFGQEKKAQATEWEIRLSNFPANSYQRDSTAVRVERIFLAADQKMLVGVVACANIAFGKHVAARFTFDYWKTTSEVAAEFNHDVRKKEANDGYDRFNFNIKLADHAHLESKTLFICVRYNVAGQEHWDNNSNMNYQVDFVKKVVPRKASTAAGAGAPGAIPRSRHTPLIGQPRPRSFPASNDDDLAAQFEFGIETTSLRNPPERRSRGRNGSIYPTQQKRGQPQQQGGAFGTRYDFGASLSAALTRAQSQMSSPPVHSALARSKSSDQVHKISSLAPRTAAPAVQPVNSPNPTKMSSDRPELGSQEYHDLIQKFCYFGSKQVSPGATSPDAAPKPSVATTEESSPLKNSTTSEEQRTKGAQFSVDTDSSDESTPNSVSSSASNSPPIERLGRSQVDGSNDSHRTSRSSTPSFHSTTSPRLIAQYRSPSPALGLELPVLLAR